MQYAELGNSPSGSAFFRSFLEKDKCSLYYRPKSSVRFIQIVWMILFLYQEGRLPLNRWFNHLCLLQEKTHERGINCAVLLDSLVDMILSQPKRKEKRLAAGRITVKGAGRATAKPDQVEIRFLDRYCKSLTIKKTACKLLQASLCRRCSTSCLESSSCAGRISYTLPLQQKTYIKYIQLQNGCQHGPAVAKCRKRRRCYGIQRADQEI